MKDYEREYNEFWKDIIEKDGIIDKEQLMKELSDFRYVMKQVPIVYDEITGGLVSKINIDASEVLNLYRERHYDKNTVDEDILDLLNEERIENFRMEVIKYFELK